MCPFLLGAGFVETVVSLLASWGEEWVKRPFRERTPIHLLGAPRVCPGRHMASSNVEDLLRALEERASTARTIFMLLDSDADGLVAVEQVGRAAAKPEFLRGSGLTAWEHRHTRAPGHSRPSLGPCASLALLTHARATC